MSEPVNKALYEKANIEKQKIKQTGNIKFD